MMANDWCPSRQHEWVPSHESLPCSWHHQGDEGVLVVWPAEYRQWARQAGLLADQRLATAVPRPVETHKAVRTRSETLEIANPPAGSTYLIDPTLRPEFQTLALRATVARPGEVEWRVNGQSIGTSSSESAMHWPLEVGVHRIAVRDSAGRTAETTVIVR